MVWLGWAFLEGLLVSTEPAGLSSLVLVFSVISWGAEAVQGKCSTWQAQGLKQEGRKEPLVAREAGDRFRESPPKRASRHRAKVVNFALSHAVFHGDS